MYSYFEQYIHIANNVFVVVISVFMVMFMVNKVQGCDSDPLHPRQEPKKLMKTCMPLLQFAQGLFAWLESCPPRQLPGWPFARLSLPLGCCSLCILRITQDGLR